ncbi:metallophosphoesterase [Lutibaculum baratangense]|uniref:Putative phosphatase n=1 Tax=Lutibaculum baratangense AMV1 TaxID=631454 RepID=V4RV74_9HYPH|nr:metallophosphoesterase [Lutibaculum baratangense]ESR26935.1 putative phosphatase [Lutibaculum baratangense AMV1]
MGTIDVIPDIHGQIAKLRTALDALGWRRRPAGWTHPDPERTIVFLGDFIDRGPENRAVIRLVRDLVDSGKARAIMGNHELNALHFHTVNPESGRPLRAHSDKNLRQHGSFLAEFPIGASETREALSWMRTLPLFLEAEGFRAVHACWIGPSIDRLNALVPNGVLSEEQVIRAADPADELHRLAEEVTKGPELRLPDGFSFRDKDGTERDHVRLQWWNARAVTWRDVAISVPRLDDLPDVRLPGSLMAQIYPSHERPVFFGHYWLSGAPVLQGPNALCLDYSAGKEGPLVTYELDPGETSLSPDRVRVHGIPA